MTTTKIWVELEVDHAPQDAHERLSEALNASAYGFYGLNVMSAKVFPELPFSPSELGLTKDLNLKTAERHLVDEALRRTLGNKTRAAQVLGISRDQLRYRLGKWKKNGATL